MMTERNGDQLIVYLSGEIDHCSAEKLRREIEFLLQDKTIMRLTMDFSHVSFMDSSGIGMLIGRYKTMAARGGLVFAKGMEPVISRLFHMAGLHRFMIEQEAEGGKNNEK